MKYETHKRTKNLTLRDIHVGDWVQAWRLLPKEYTPPMKVSSIHYDGTVYLVSDDESHCTPFEANITEIDALPIDEDLLIGFGFEKDGNFYSYGSCVFAVDNQLDVMDFSYINRYAETMILGDIAYMHELQQVLYDKKDFIEDFEPEWKGVEKCKERYCGECKNLLYEDACGYGECKLTGEPCRCSDKCHLTHGKP